MSCASGHVDSPKIVLSGAGILYSELNCSGSPGRSVITDSPLSIVRLYDGRLPISIVV